eukprot:s1136_g7.t1
MSSLIDSGAQFESQLKDAGLPVTFIDSLKRHGVKTLGQLAFAVGQPGQPIQDASVEQLVQNALGRPPTLQETACVKRAAFEAQTYLTATLRQAVDRSEDALPQKIPVAERQTRMEALKTGLTGLSVTGEHEPAHCLLDRSEIKVHYAMIRRGLTFQFAKLMSYAQHCEWETFLFEALHREPPPGYSRPSLAQMLQCDKAAFTRLASTMSSIRQRDDGTYPLGVALLELRGDPMIALHLAPTAKPVQAAASGSSPWRSQPYASSSPSKGKGGSGKGKGKTKSPPVPQELRGKWHKTSSGDPICFGYNCKSGCSEKHVKPGQRCSKGYHVCAEPRCGADHSLQQHGSK